MPTADVSDVKQVIATSLSDSDIQDSLDWAADWNTRTNNPGQQSTAETTDIERWAAVVNIRQFKERSVSEDSVGGSSSVFEGDELELARKQLAGALSDAGENPLKASNLVTDSNRHISTSS